MHVRRLLVAVVSLVALSASAKGRDSFDALSSVSTSQELSSAAQNASAKGALVEHFDARLGLPTFVSANPGRASSQGALLRGSARSPEYSARAYLGEFADFYRLQSADVSAATTKSVSSFDGASIVQFAQKIGGIDVFRNELKVLMDRDLNLVALSGYLSRGVSSAEATSLTKSFTLGADAAVAKAFTDLTGGAIGNSELVSLGSADGGYVRFDMNAGARAASGTILTQPARAKKVFYTLPSGYEPAYYVEVEAGAKDAKDSDFYSYVVSAKDGQVLFRNNLTASDSYSYRVWADSNPPYIPFDGPQGNDATPHPTGVPDGYQAPFVASNLITLQNSPFSRNDPWLAPNATQTTGNNVDAYADVTSPDGFQANTGDLRAETTSAGVFDHAFDLARAPDASVDQRKAAVTELFYLNNFFHDWYYDAGFDEASGNGQLRNYGRGGIEGDSIRAEAQDSSGRNNANMSTPADGGRPRMQMYIFDGVPAIDVTAPASIARGYIVGTAAFGALVYDLAADVKILDPAGTTLACTAFPADTFAGKIALLDRGVCGFAVKAKFAQDAGAKAVVIANNAAGAGAPGMAGTDPTLTIPTVSISLEDAKAWKNEVKTNGSTISMTMKKTADLDRDGTLDNGIVAHEWGHYISNRLIGNSSGLYNNQGRSMGEGWADFHALLMQVRDEDRTRPGNDRFQGVYTAAGYTQSGGANNGYYFGIRRVPYTTDMTKNALTLKHIATGTALPTSHPLYLAKVSSDNAEFHNAGEVWATMLWECYASLLNAYPFQEAQDRMKRYLIAGYKLTPNGPTFLEARDALLAAAQASDSADYARFVQAFAKRGAGFGAKAPDRDSSTHIGVVESFTAGNHVSVTAKLEDGGCDQDYVLDNGETANLAITVSNDGFGAIGGSTITVASSNPNVSFPNGNTFTLPMISRGLSASGSVQVALAGETAVTSGGFTITVAEPSLPAGSQATAFAPRMNYDEAPLSSNTDTFEASRTAWSSSSAGTTDRVVRRGDEANHYWHLPDSGVPALHDFVSPWIQVNPTGDFQIQFNYRHGLETGYDGAVLEVTDDGVHWYDLYSDLGIDPGYNAFLALDGGNPLEGRPAYTGVSTAYPSFRSKTLNLGTMLAGAKVKFRFRTGSDAGAAGDGFDVDNFTVINAATMPFTGLVAETAAPSCNARPIAIAGQLTDIYTPTVPEGTIANKVLTRKVVTLDGAGSVDPEGSALSYSWTQVSGEQQELVNANTATPSFTVDISADSILTFQLVVTDADGNASAPAFTTAMFTNVNRDPEVLADSGFLAEELTTVTLGASATDADGETLTFTWAQTAGTPVVLTGADTDSATFTAPEVSKSGETLTFVVTVDDGHGGTGTAIVQVLVYDKNHKPKANAGGHQIVGERSTVTLSAAASVDDDGDVLSFQWSQEGTPVVTFSNPESMETTFVAPDVAADTILTFVVSVNDGSTLPPEIAPTALTTVEVKNINRAPTAVAKDPHAAGSGETVTLDASKSSDVDGEALTYHWRQVGGPAVTLSSQTDATVTFAAPELPSGQGQALAFELLVTDASGATSSQIVSVQVIGTTAPQAAGCSTTGPSSGGSMLGFLALLGVAFASRRKVAVK